MFPHGFAGADVAAEVAPEGWERSPLAACFHPSMERVFAEQLQLHRNIESLFGSSIEHREPEPTLDDVRADYQASPLRPDEELTELIGQCLWDVFSDNHEVVAADGRAADIGSFRGASAFLDQYVRGEAGDMCGGDHMRFYMGSIWTSARADLTLVYVLIFRRLHAIGADWIYHFPDLELVEFGSGSADLERLRADIAASNARAREHAMDCPAPPTVLAYREVYGRDPRGWPPA